MSAVTGLNAFERDVLWSLAHEPNQRGIDILDRLGDYYGERLNHSRLYPVLDRLADAGFVEKSHRNGRANNYRLTEKGETALDRRTDWQRCGSR